MSAMARRVGSDGLRKASIPNFVFTLMSWWKVFVLLDRILDQSASVLAYPLVIQQFAMENGPFVDGLPNLRGGVALRLHSNLLE